MSSNAQDLNSGNICLNSGAVAAGTNAGSIKTTAIVNYTINGVFKSKAATDNIALPAPSVASDYTAGEFRSMAIGQKCLFALFLDGDGNFSFGQSAIVGSDEPAPVIAQKNGCAVVAVFTVKTTSAIFVPGTTVLGTGNTTTYYNTMVMPGSSLT